MTTIPSLPPYPSSNARKTLPASSLAKINETVVSALSAALDLPISKLGTIPGNYDVFVSSYLKDQAVNVLQSLIWETKKNPSRTEKVIHKQVLQLVGRLAAIPSSLQAQTLLDFAIVYGSTNLKTSRKIFESVFQNSTSLLGSFESEVVPAFMALLVTCSSAGLYGLRKTAHCLISLLHTLPSEAIRLFYVQKDLALALAQTYDSDLASLAQSYGGIHTFASAENRELDDWERIWLETKTALLDSFHVIISNMLKDVASADPSNQSQEADRVFDLVFALNELSGHSNGESIPSSSTLPTPFLNRSLLADYQHSYGLSRSLASALSFAAEKDARLDLLEASLHSYESLDPSGSKNPGVLKLLLRSSGRPMASSLINKNVKGDARGLGKIKAADVTPGMPPTQADPEIDAKIAQVLDILPSFSPKYIRALLLSESHPFRGNPEKVIEALLEGTAPTPEQTEGTSGAGSGTQQEITQVAEEDFVFTKNRRNLFDDEVIDVSQARFGKKVEESQTDFFSNREYMEQMKADILRRAEDIAAAEDDDGEEEDRRRLASADKGKKPVGWNRGDDFSDFDSDGIERFSVLNVAGDGEESDESEEKAEPSAAPSTPETILELAYIRDPKLFGRDAQTRRSKQREMLRTESGWDDNQIEGWRIMLERNPRKDKILQRHEFAGNRAFNAVTEINTPTPSGSNANTNQNRGGNRGSRGGGGRGRGGEGSGAGSEGGSARDRARNDRHKASRANHNRKRGHDKKMARGGAIVTGD